MFQRRLKGVSREISVGFKVNGVSSNLMCVWEILMVFSKLSKKFQGSFKRVLRKFQGYFKIVSRAFQESVKCASRKFHKKFQGCIKNL